MSAEVKILGIRHHGPGSARALKRALRDFVPDIVLVEAPQEAEPLFSQVLHPGLELPVALLLYSRQDFQRAVYLPFAEFSPELQALRFALQGGIPVRAIDLPVAVQFGQQISQEVGDPGTDPTDGVDAEKIRRDPLHFIAELAGFRDSERWWEATFEQMDNSGSVFELILELMTALRHQLMRTESRETILREAWMRQCLRQAVGDGFQRIAVVCGAWHAPVLDQLDEFPEKPDRALIRGLKKDKVSAAWIPWSYDRLAFQSGYGAGVISPAWYELLFRHRDALAVRWMVRAGRLFRQEGYATSPAHVQEAVRLAETLSAMRSKSVPGMEELEDAGISVFCEGSAEALDLIRERLVIGVQLGKVPPDFSMTPLQQDLERCVKAARLTREFQTTERLNKVLDLRTPANLRASHLLHRLRLLDIPWGEPAQIRGESQGAFKEAWKLKWKPDYAIRLIQAGLWGMRIQQAALNRTLDRVTKLESLPKALELLQLSLHASLPEASNPIIRKLQEFAATTKEVDLLLVLLPNLVQILRYGSTRKTDRDAVSALVDEIIPRICIGLPDACRDLEEELAQEWFTWIIGAHQAIHLLPETQKNLGWHQALSQLALGKETHPALAGLATRLLLDDQVWAFSSVESLLYAALSSPEKALESALWLEGFTHGSALLLLHTPELWPLVEQWVREIPGEQFKNILPVLRRAFSRFSLAERKMLWGRIHSGRLPREGMVFGKRITGAYLGPVTGTLDVLFGKESPEGT